ncbi:ATP-binding protein [Pandoraea sp. PE-S2R-1]|uniref:ATP-binding protein n=1 Tax=Pandoraea sp. PE-S2R-1 TaxID=1986994 RepID=UPI000B403382|nr:ATP-binding protein [Pandoraea sp. PE-S2R-1]
MPQSQKDSSKDDREPLGNFLIWTPEIDALAEHVARCIRLGLPGIAVTGKPRVGKTNACKYLKHLIPQVMGHNVCVLNWEIPESLASEREQIQCALQNMQCAQFSHRDIAILRSRLMDEIYTAAGVANSRRLLFIIDEAQNLKLDFFGLLVHVYNMLDYNHYKPFFLLVAQPELTAIRHQLAYRSKYQVLGRFFNDMPEFCGILPEDFDAVLTSFDTPAREDDPPPACAYVPNLYEYGWRLNSLAHGYRAALEVIRTEANIERRVRMPMQHFRMVTIDILDRLGRGELTPEQIDTPLLVDAFKASGFHNVVLHYVDE